MLTYELLRDGRRLHYGRLDVEVVDFQATAESLLTLPLTHDADEVRVWAGCDVSREPDGVAHREAR